MQTDRQTDRRIYLVEASTHVDGTVLNDVIDRLWDGSCEIWIRKLHITSNSDWHFHDCLVNIKNKKCDTMESLLVDSNNTIWSLKHDTKYHSFSFSYRIIFIFNFISVFNNF